MPHAILMLRGHLREPCADTQRRWGLYKSNRYPTCVAWRRSIVKNTKYVVRPPCAIPAPSVYGPCFYANIETGSTVRQAPREGHLVSEAEELPGELPKAYIVPLT